MKTTMRAFVAVLTISLIVQTVALSVTTAKSNLSDRLWKAICKVESNNNPRAIGDRGKAVGIAQLHMGVVKDCNRIIGKQKYTSADRYSPAKSREMWQIYLNFYVPNGTPEQLARCWNGGKGNMNRKCTVKYWAKVRNAMR